MGKSKEGRREKSRGRRSVESDGGRKGGERRAEELGGQVGKNMPSDVDEIKKCKLVCYDQIYFRPSRALNGVKIQNPL